MALALLGWAGLAQALGLGEIEIRSRLNQPISALIPISAAAGEADDLIVELASNDEFDRAGMERSEFLSSLRFELQGDAIKVTSKQIAREPFVSFLVDVRWSGGRLLREYTVLLDPPAMAQAPAQAAPATAAATGPTTTNIPAPPAEAPPAPAEPASAPAEAEAAPTPATNLAGDTYGPTAPKETLWSIAYKLRPDPRTITMDQMQVAIFKANPQAFDKGRLTGLMKGQTLRIPSADDIRAVDAASAKAQVANARSSGSSPATSRAAAPSSTELAPAAPIPAPSEPLAQAEPAPKAEAPITPPAETPPAQAEVQSSPATPPAEVAQAPVETPPPPAETQAPVATETTPPPAETAPPAVATPPPPDEPGMLAELAERGKGLVNHPFFIPALAGIVVLLALVFGGRKIADKVAKLRYERASQKPAVAPAAIGAGAGNFGDEDVTQVAPEPPMSVTQTQALGEQPLQATMQQTVQQTQVVAPAAAQSGQVDFDVTGNFANETVQISLDAGDPVSEAEFHRAYGLYDEAALLLKQALQKDPTRTDAKVKLAEIYFEAGKANEFVEVVQGLKGQVSDEEWQKLTLLGSQIAPNHDLFKGGGLAAGGTVDLSFDEPATSAAPVAPAAPVAAPVVARAAPADDSIDFKFDDIELPAATPAPAPAAAPADGGLEFDLGSLSLDMPSTADAPAAATAETAMPTAEPSLDLGSFDLDVPSSTSEGGDIVELGADAGFEVSGGGDESSTKLDLARAYIDMGDGDMARSLLNEVTQQGNPEQQKEAKELLKRVTG
ncbi:MAG TPA: FimV/HubP family polar landmark protein [Verrucomicrobiae bacterium]|nr:FimV/HubP family polar landmark protein [Verrucomicrobiae bacterium]